MKLLFRIKSQEQGQLVREYLFHVRAFSNQLLKKIKNNGKILLNGEEVTVRATLKNQDELMIKLPVEKVSPAITPVNGELNLIYEDEHILIVNKKRGLAVLPNPNDPSGKNLAAFILDYYERNQKEGAIHIVNRLDRYTSGVVMIAKHRYMHHLMQQCDVYKRYIAVVEGEMSKRSATVNYPISRNLPSIIERKIDPNGKRAITHYRLLRVIGNDSLVELILETGRTHQIRVHMASIGHPLVGDDLYGGSNKRLYGQALHCREVSFIHPVTSKLLTCFANVPEDLMNLH
ncbi:RluA family pseudouridine synthase [Halalkalibacillus halophilus]|uniref:RluA family pseudouridine synthase n=1 Tax=Halalkalibacillus halophilus TaxID=392827 RepID=UPI00042959AE|nr:RluA family pseudouridine synthase [Halalkalibacillus halophilus]